MTEMKKTAKAPAKYRGEALRKHRRTINKLATRLAWDAEDCPFEGERWCDCPAGSGMCRPKHRVKCWTRWAQGDK